ncbi:MAG: VOC family protein [Candidatus Yanofskybacteria bacterium]|nr:VOC family protein [Candidatus Yanofskybacteria bacterium]
MQKIVPSFWFEKNCEEAIKFYIDVFNSNPARKQESKIVTLKRYPDKPMPGLPIEGLEGKILTVIFELEGQRFMALDGGPVFKPNGAVSLYVECETQQEVDHYWEKLTEGGNPQAQQCGWLQDKYGFSWQIVPKILGELLSSPDKEKADRVTQAMLKMKKIDIANLKEAAGE